MRIFVAVCLIFLILSLNNFAYAETTSSVSPSLVQKIEYELAYPGILPDNPLYIFKAARDKMVGFLINDPSKKAEFDLLTSDKRFYAAVFLVDKDKDALAISTLSKGNNYFEDAITKSNEAKTKGIDTKQLTQRLLLSSLKHQEVVKLLDKKIEKEYKQALEDEGRRVERYIKTVSSMQK